MEKKFSPQEIQQRNGFFHAALQEEKNQHWKAALDLYRMSLKIDSNFFDSWLNAGAIYARSGKSDKAITCFQRAIISRPDKRAYYNLASEYFKQNRIYHALDTAERCVQIDSAFLQGHLLVGYCYGKLNEGEKAEKAILTALKLQKGNRQAMTALVLLYFQQERWEECSRYINYLLAENPNDTVIQRMKASLSLQKGDLRQSILDFREIVDKDTNLKRIYNSLDKNWSEKSKAKVLHSKLELSEKKDKSKQDYLDLSLLSLFSGEPRRAMEYLMMAAPSDKKHKLT